MYVPRTTWANGIHPLTPQPKEKIPTITAELLVVFDHIYTTPSTGPEVSRATGISNSAVFSIMKRLVKLGVVAATEFIGNANGTRASRYGAKT